MKEIGLMPEQQAMADEIEDLLLAKMRVDVMPYARFLVSTDNHELLRGNRFFHFAICC